MSPFILKLAVVAVHIAEIFPVVHRKENPSINNGRCGYIFINAFKYITPANEQIFLKTHVCWTTFCKNSDVELHENLKNTGR